MLKNSKPGDHTERCQMLPGVAIWKYDIFHAIIPLWYNLLYTYERLYERLSVIWKIVTDIDSVVVKKKN